MLATFEQVLSLLKLLTPELAAKDHAAHRINPIGEVLTGDGGGASHPVRWMASPCIRATLIAISVVATSVATSASNP